MTKVSWTNYRTSQETINACRQYETRFNFPQTNGWTVHYQYNSPDVIRKNMKVMWSFGVSKEINFEEGIRKDNSSVKIYTWDPTPIALITVKKSPANVTHTAKAFDPSERPMNFYTTHHKKKCWSLENHDPGNLVDTMTVETENMDTIVARLGTNVDMIKADIEGRWYELWHGMVKHNILPSFVTIEFEMYFNNIHIEISKLDEVVDWFKQNNYNVYLNRKLTGPHVELCFYKQ